MRLEDYPEKDGRRVWLNRPELDAVLEAARQKDVERYIALAFAGRCGLQKKEVLDVTPADLVETNGGLRVRV